MASLVYKPTAREAMWRNPDRPFRQPDYGDAFEDYDISGFDECFPNIAEGIYPEYPWKGTGLVDHGELWCTPWDWEFDDGRLHLWTHGTRFPYRFDKWLSGSGQSVRLDYQLTSVARHPFKFLWSAHPLFAACPGMRVLLPEGIRVRVDWSKDLRLGPLCTEHSWPITHDAHGQEVDLSTIRSGEMGFADKLYTTRLSEGRCALFDPETQDFVAFTFSPDEVPYVGIWINQGGWPLQGKTCFNVALEPCVGYPDRLDIAVLRHEVCSVSAKGTRKWHLNLRAGRTANVFSALDETSWGA